jgi:hypothetical protein
MNEEEVAQTTEPVDTFQKNRRAFAAFVSEGSLKLHVLGAGDQRPHSEWMPERIVGLDDYRKHPRGMLAKGRVYWYQGEDFQEVSLEVIRLLTPNLLMVTRMPSAVVYTGMVLPTTPGALMRPRQLVGYSDQQEMQVTVRYQYETWHQPSQSGVYACRVPLGETGKRCDDRLLLWLDGQWSYLGSGERYRGEVRAWLGPLPRVHVKA